jgi:murein DD-endopeptidase MepM/ murein hydrolase activator NlpD
MRLLSVIKSQQGARQRQQSVLLALAVLVLANFISACGPAQPAVASVIIVTATLPPTPEPNVVDDTALAVIANSSAPTFESGPTATPYPTTDFQSNIGATAASFASPTTTAIAFDFGTQTPFPTLSWRPAPYPVPLSVRPEDHFWFIRPIASNAVNWPLPVYRYGSTFFGFMNAHTGVDLDSPYGTPVLAAGDGVVVWTGYGLLGVKPPEDDPYGNAVVIKHNFGYNGQDMYTVYAHMSEVLVWKDQPVKAGEQIGKVGSTGNSSGPHLHFEVRIGENKFRSSYNPELWLAPPTGWGVLVGRVLDSDGRLIPELPIDVYDSDGRYYGIVTYSTRNVNADPLYQENFVLSDLPAGPYKLVVTIDGQRYIGVTDITAGQSTFVILQQGVDPRGGMPRTAEPRATNGPFPGLTQTKRPPRPSATFIAGPSSTPTFEPTITPSP